MPIKTDGANQIPNAHLINTQTGGKISLSLHTEGDEQLTLMNRDQLAHVSLDEIRNAKGALVLDAADGKLDFRAAGFELQKPNYRMFWTKNSAAALMLRLAGGERDLVINGRKVEVTQGFKDWVNSTMTLERVGAPLGG